MLGSLPVYYPTDKEIIERLNKEVEYQKDTIAELNIICKAHEALIKELDAFIRENIE